MGTVLTLSAPLAPSNLSSNLNTLLLLEVTLRLDLLLLLPTMEQFLWAVLVLLVDMELVPYLVVSQVVVFLVVSLVDILVVLLLLDILLLLSQVLLVQELLVQELLQKVLVPLLLDVSIVQASLFLAVNKEFKKA